MRRAFCLLVILAIVLIGGMPSALLASPATKTPAVKEMQGHRKATHTPTGTPMVTSTPVPTATRTAVPTNTPTRTPTNTPVLSTATHTPLPPTPTDMPTDTPTVVSTPTSTPPPTSTRAPTATNTPTTTHTPAAGNVYFVSPGGNDANAGTFAAPWKTIAKVNSMAFVAGDIVSFQRGGIWSGLLSISASGALGNPITLTAYGVGEDPVIDNPSTGETWNRGVYIDGNYVVLDHFIVRNVNGSFGSAIAVWGNNNTIQNNEVDGSTFGIDVAGAGNSVTGNYVHDCVMINPNDGSGATGILIKNRNEVVSYNRVENCKAPSNLFGTDGGFLEIYGTVDGSYIHHNWAQGNDGFLEAGSSGGTGTANNITIAYNVSYLTGHFIGIHGTGSEMVTFNNWKVDNNTVVENGDFASMYFYANVTPTQFYLRNNIFYLNNVTYVLYNDGIHTVNWTRQNNLYYYASTAWHDFGFTLGASERIADPQFIDLSAPDLHLQATSPAIGAGINLGYGSDFDNRPVPMDSAPDVGAYEYVP